MYSKQKLMELNRKEACGKNCCGPCQQPYQISTTMPENSALVTGAPVTCGQKTSQPSSIPTNSASPLACPEWNAGVIDASKNCCTPAAAAANYYPLSMKDVIVPRLAVPGGGVPLTGGDPNMYF